MTAVKEYFDRQYGKGAFKHYDNVLHRLRCTKDDEQIGISQGSIEGCNVPVFACKFSQQNDNLFAMANEDGKLAVNDVSKKQESHDIQAHNNVIFDLSWMFGQMKIVTGSGDHLIKLFNVSNSDIREEKTFYGHIRSVKTVTSMRDDYNIFASGGRDGQIILWDARTEHLAGSVGNPDRIINNSHTCRSTTPHRFRKKNAAVNSPLNLNAKTVTGLVFQDCNTLISCGAGDGIIKVWDLRKNYLNYKREPLPKYCINYNGKTPKNGFSDLLINETGTKLYANCLDNKIYCYNISSYDEEPLMKYTGHQNNTFYIKSSLSKDGMYLISGSSNENAYIWNTSRPHPAVKLSGHAAEVTCVAWSDSDNITVVTCSEEMKRKIWRIGSEEFPEDWQVIGRGQAEILPLEYQQKPTRKRYNSAVLENATPKKIVTECIRCGSATENEKCENCDVFMKRKQPEQLDYESKRSRRLFSVIQENVPLASPKPVQKTPENSPTVNLPNYIVDGIAPHVNYSPLKKRPHDWLTKLRIDKSLHQRMTNSVEASSPKIPRLDSRECKFDNGDRLTNKNVLQSSILNYFKVTNASVSLKYDLNAMSKSYSASNMHKPFTETRH